MDEEQVHGEAGQEATGNLDAPQTEATGNLSSVAGLDGSNATSVEAVTASPIEASAEAVQAEAVQAEVAVSSNEHARDFPTENVFVDRVRQMGIPPEYHARCLAEKVVADGVTQCWYPVTTESGQMFKVLITPDD